MLGRHTDELYQLAQAATNWRNTAATVGVDLFQINAAMPDGRAVVLKWEAEAVPDDPANPGDWVVTAQ